MKRRSTIEASLMGVAAALLAAAFVLASAPLWVGADEPFIDTAADVRPEQCAPCHIDIGDVDVEGLIFSHGNHLLVNCSGCHFRMPHRGDVTERVAMSTCFACHGVDHGPQGELATGECADCHTDPEKLRPVSHGLNWAGLPHAEVSRASGVNACMMCHESIADCDTCHAKEAPDVPEMPITYHSMVTPLPKGPSVKIVTAGEVTMSKCSYCHAGIDDTDPARLTFAHADHIGRNYRCAACHERFAHTALGTLKPDMLSCYRCHGTKHNSSGLIATPECIACHPVSFELMPPDHTKRFIKGEHADPANERPEYCAMCHESAFCTGCHRGEKTSPNAPGRQVIPAAHTDARWQGQHGKDYLKGEGVSCGVCHEGTDCEACHNTVVPHPVGFVENHKPKPGTTSEDCRICHRDQRACQECHHEGVKNKDLVASNCVPCHPQMKQQPPTAIKHKSFAEHAVHFQVEEATGKPYRCYECHVDFGSSEQARSIAIQQGHDMRLCYSCHGALDQFNQLIAPYSGGTLCLRCHTDMDI